MPDDLSPPGVTPSFRPGWYPDPVGRFELRFHNGERWTADVSSDGSRYVDPLGLAAPGARSSGAATASMVLGIIAVSTAWMPFLVVVGILAGLVAIGLGLASLRRTGQGPGRGRALAGVTMGGCALVAAVLGVLLTLLVIDVYDAYVDPEPHEVAIQSCDLAGSRASAVGELTNLGDETADFSVVIGYVRPGTSDVQATSRVDVDDVAAGASAPFETQRQVPLDDIECVVVDVTGPLPFGIDID